MSSIHEIAWWFAKEPKLPHGDNRKVIIGETLTVEPPLVLCEHGLHWSLEPFDALNYATGNLLYKVKPIGDFILDHEKGCSVGRMALETHDIKELLYYYARKEALSVIHKWDAPQVVRDYLENGNETIRLDAAEATPKLCLPNCNYAALAGVYATNYFSLEPWIIVKCVLNCKLFLCEKMQESRTRFNDLITEHFTAVPTKA